MVRQLKCECSEKIYAKGMCWHCYRRQYDMAHKRPEIICKNCNKKGEHQAFGMCKSCYNLKYHRTEENKEKRMSYEKTERRIKHRREYVIQRLKNPLILKKKKKWNKLWVHKKWKTDNYFRLKTRARQKANYHLSCPDICDICGKKDKLQRHHEDYSRPLDVMFLCKKCHYKKDMELQGIKVFV